MAGIDTSAADQQDDGGLSVDAILNDVSEQGLAWYAAITGKGVVRQQTPAGQVVAGVTPGTTLAGAESPTASVLAQVSPVVLVGGVAVLVILAVLLVK